MFSLSPIPAKDYLTPIRIVKNQNETPLKEALIALGYLADTYISLSTKKLLWQTELVTGHEANTVWRVNTVSYFKDSKILDVLLLVTKVASYVFIAWYISVIPLALAATAKLVYKYSYVQPFINSLKPLEIGIIKSQSIGNPQDTNFPKDAEGRTYHLGLKAGELANEVLLVGDPDRAKLIVDTCFDKDKDIFTRSTNRGFTTYTGFYEGKRVSVVSIGMGTAMMDFFCREARAITEGVVNWIRLGSCGTPQAEIPAGTVAVAKESLGIFTNYKAFYQPKKDKPNKYYKFTPAVKPNEKMHQLLVKNLVQTAKSKFPVMEGKDATADSFYSSQGRQDKNFVDHNESLIENALKLHPNIVSLQMETHTLYDLAARCVMHDINASSCTIILANRIKNDFLPNDRKHEIEILAGKACLETLTQFKSLHVS